MRRLILVFAVASLASPWFNSAFADDWSPLWSTATLSQSRAGLAITSVNGIVFFAGGSDASGAPSSVVDIYDTSTGVWSTTNLSQPRTDLSAASAGNEALFFSGSGPSGNPNIVDIYHTVGGTLSTATISQGRYYGAAAAAGGKVLFGGGRPYSSPVDIYDSASGTLSVAALSGAVGQNAATSVDNKVLFAGGEYANWQDSSTVDIYDATAGTWSHAALSQARYGLAAASAGGKAFFAGGEYFDGGHNMKDTVDIYNRASNSWSVSHLSQPRRYLAGASVGSKVLFAGGQTANVGAASDVVDIYDTATAVWSVAHLSMPCYYYVSEAATAGNRVFFAGGIDSNSQPTGVVDIYTLQSYPTITSAKTFTLQDQTTVTGLMQLGGGSLGLATYNLAIGSMAGSAPIDLGSQTLTVGSDNTSTTYSGIISDAGNLVKIGSGTLVLTATNTYTGPTTITQGKLVVDGRLTNSAVSVNGGTLGGTGSLASVMVYSGGNLAPGDAPGTLNISGNLILSAGAVMDYDLDTPSTSDKISCNSLALNLQQFSDFNFAPSANFAPGSYNLIGFASSSGSLGANTSGTVDGYPATLSLQNNDLVLTVVPEPGSLALLFVGMVALGIWRLRRKA